MSLSRRLLCLFAFLAGTLAPLGGTAQVPTTVTKSVAPAVVLVQARKCSGDTPSRNGTGFAVDNSSEVVTAYHVVAGCDEIELWYEYANGTPSRTSTLSRVLKRHDLALLTVSNPPTSAYFTIAGALDPDKDLKALGYGLGSPSLSDLDLRVAFGSARLNQMLPTENMRDLARTSIDTSQTIIRFSRPLMPGMSGGPIFDANGRVVAVVAGGLKNGAVSSSWGWPATLVATLRQSKETPDRNVSVTGTTFAFATDDKGDAESLTCGSLTFVKDNTLSFAEAASTSDNIARLQMTTGFSGVPLHQIEAFQFQTWVNPRSGATVVIPNNVDLLEDGDTCLAQSDDGVFQQVIKADPAATPFEIQQASTNFEYTVMQPQAMPNIGWYPDNVLTQGLPATRQDGLVVNRKAVFVGKQNLGPGKVLAIHQFETLMARGGSFVGIAMTNNEVEQCLNALNQPVLCSIDPDYLRNWAHFVLATQMSTYPIF